MHCRRNWGYIEVGDTNLIDDFFHERLKKETARLNKLVDELEGPEKVVITDLLHRLEQECSKYEGSEISDLLFGEDEKERTLAAIIEHLNKIEAQVKDLEVSSESQQLVSSRAVADRIVSQFFYDCQVAEDRIKEYGSWAYLTKKQIDDLNTQLKNLVHRMIQVSKKSELLIEAILESYAAKILS